MVRGATISPPTFFILKDNFFRFRVLANTGDGRAEAAKWLRNQYFAPRELKPKFLMNGTARSQALPLFHQAANGLS
jgi:hypothetical protein